MPGGDECRHRERRRWPKVASKRRRMPTRWTKVSEVLGEITSNAALSFLHLLIFVRSIKQKGIWLLIIIISTLNNNSRCISCQKLDQQSHWWVFFFSPSWWFPSSLAGLAPLQPPPPPLQQVTFKLCFCNFFALKTATPSVVHSNRNTKSNDMQLESATHHTSATTTTTCSGASATCPTGYTKDSDGTKCYIRR